jgi:hypothetical protein
MGEAENDDEGVLVDTRTPSFNAVYSRGAAKTA